MSAVTSYIVELTGAELELVAALVSVEREGAQRRLDKMEETCFQGERVEETRTRRDAADSLLSKLQKSKEAR